MLNHTAVIKARIIKDTIEIIIPCGITEASSNGLVDSKSVPLGWTPIIGHISLIGQLHGTYIQYDFGAAMTPAIKPKKPIAMLANVPFHVAIHNCSGIMASDTPHAVRLAAKILNHGKYYNAPHCQDSFLAFLS